MAKTATKLKEKTQSKLPSRPPVVVVLGHIDHGKSTLLHKLREAEMPKEAGGITQKIGAYELTTKDGKITFIDTPGHEAFEKVRSYGAQVADVAVLVVAADQGVQDQTKEAIQHIKKAGLPLVVAINKVDLKNANPAKVKAQLLEAGVQLEEQGGEVPAVEVSAKTGKNLGGLLELISLVAQLQDLKASSEGQAQGVVIAAKRDPQEGLKNTLLVREGKLKKGDFVVIGSMVGRVRNLKDWQGQPLEQAEPSMPVEVLGLPRVVAVGQPFFATSERQKAQEQAGQAQREEKFLDDLRDLAVTKSGKTLHLIIKADDPGSLAAIAQEILGKLNSKEVGLKVVRADVGSIGVSDIEMARSSEPALIVGFNVTQEAGVDALAQNVKVAVASFETIYELVDGVRLAMEELLKPEIQRKEAGSLRVLEVFRKEKESMIVGGEVKEGELRPGLKLEVIRDGEKIGQGELIGLKRGKQAAKQVEAGQEVGVFYKGEPLIKPGDVLRAFEEKAVRPKL